MKGVNDEGVKTNVFFALFTRAMKSSYIVEKKTEIVFVKRYIIQLYNYLTYVIVYRIKKVGSYWLFFFSFLVGYTPVSVVRHINIVSQSASIMDCNKIFGLHVGSMVGLSILRVTESFNPA